MAIRISQLQTATSVDGNEFIVIVQNGVTKKITIGETLFEGAQGPAGTGYVFKGNWSSITGYVVNDVVVYNGSSYVSKTNNNVNHTPGDNTYWGVVALKGDTGAAGATGATGPQGAQGAVGPQGPVGSLDLDANVINNYPNVRPTIDLNFEHQDILDSRVALTRGCEATYFDEFGTLKIAATNEPVFDNNPETGESKGLYVAGPSTDLLFSGLKNDFSAWNKIDTTVTSNVAVAPDGTLTADQVIESTGVTSKSVNYGSNLTVAINRFYTFSVFVKKGIRANAPDHVQLAFQTAQFSTNSFVNFNISNGTITRIGSSIYDAKIVKLPNGWFRISITALCATASSVASGGPYVLFINNNPVAAVNPSYTGSTQSDVLVWGPQLEESKRLTPYKYNPYGVVQAQSAVAWTLTNVTAIANFTKAPDESYTAERIAETVTNAAHSFTRTSIFTAVAGKTYTTAVYLKKGIGATAPDNVGFQYTNTFFANGLGANFNIATGGVNTLSGATTATIEHVGDGWYKCVVSCTATSAGTASLGIGFTNNSTTTITPNPTYAGQTTSDLFVWGMHTIEDSATIPEYIRKADVAVINAPNKLPLLEGTVVAKAELPQDLAVDIPFAIPERDKYLFDAKSGNNRVSLYVRKPKNVIAQGTEFQTKNLFLSSEGGLSTLSSVSTGISGVVNGIAGFDNALVFPTNDAARNAYRAAALVSGQVYTLSMFVQMDDGSAPVPGGQTSDKDFGFVLQGVLQASGVYYVQQVSGTLYRVSASYTSTLTTTSSANNGIVKYTQNSNKTFKVTGFQLELGNTATSYQKTTAVKTWSNVNTITMPDQIAAPTGGVFADRIFETTASGTHSVLGTFIPKENHDYLYSVYVKKGVGVTAPNIIRLTTSKGGVFSANFADFNIASGAVEYSTGCTGSVTDAGNGWYRCSILFPTPEGKVSAGLELSNLVYIQFTNNTVGAASSGLIYAGSVDTDIFAWGAQVEEFERTYPLTFVSNASSGVLTRASSATIDGFDYGIDVARYSGSGVIVEEGTTNLLLNTDGNLATYSNNDLNTSASSNITDALIPLSGFSNSVQFGDNSVERFGLKTRAFIAGSVYSFSFYIQMDDNGVPSFGSTSGNDAQIRIAGSPVTVAANVTLVTGSIYRVSITQVVPAFNSGRVGVWKLTTNSSRGFRVTGYQLELKSYPTSYIESGAATYTRAPEILTMSVSGMVKGDWTIGLMAQRYNATLPNVSNILWECVIDSNNLYRLQLVSDAAQKTTGAIQAVIVSNGVTCATKPSKVIENNTLYDIAWSGNGVKSLISINGEIVDVLHYAEPVGALPAVATVGSGVNGVYSALFIAKPALNEFQLKQFTTLTALPEPTFIPSVYEDGTLPLYTAELTDASGNVTRAEYAAQLPEGAHKFGLSWNKEKLALFIDGVKVSEKTGQFTLTSSPNTSTICSDYNNKSQWDGSIQRISIYPRKLDDTIIQAITE